LLQQAGRAIAYVGVVNPEKKVFTDNGL
jgi:hypothetical protein